MIEHFRANTDHVVSLLFCALISPMLLGFVMKQKSFCTDGRANVICLLNVDFPEESGEIDA